MWGISWVQWGVFSKLGDIMSTLGVIMCTQRKIIRCMWGVIMSTLGDVQYKWGIHWVHRGCSSHRRDTMSSLGGIMSTPGDFGTNEKKPLSNFEDFCSRIFCDYLYVGIWNIRQLVKISLLGSQSPDPEKFVVSSLLKSLQFQNVK